LIKALISVSILLYLAYAIDWGTLWTRFKSLYLPYYTGALALMAFPIALTSLRWQVILRAQGIRIPIRKVVSFDLIALFFNSFLPGSTGGDAARVYYAITLYPREKTRIVLSILADRGIGLFALLVFGFAILQLQPDIFTNLQHITRVVAILPLIVTALIVGMLIVFALPFFRRSAALQRFISSLPQHALIQNALLFIRQFAKKPAIAFAALAITAFSYLFNFTSGYLVAAALGIPMTLSQVIVILAVVHTVTALPLSVSGHGVRELLLIGLFSALGLATASPMENAIAFSILLFSVQLFWSLIGGLYYLTSRPRSVHQ
jgi:uncharacterized protein (TIRG00374 family)